MPLFYLCQLHLIWCCGAILQLSWLYRHLIKCWMSVVSKHIDHRGCKVKLTPSMLHWGTCRPCNYRHRRVYRSSLTADADLQSMKQQQEGGSQCEEVLFQKKEKTDANYSTDFKLHLKWWKDEVNIQVHYTIMTFDMTQELVLNLIYYCILEPLAYPCVQVMLVVTRYIDMLSIHVKVAQWKWAWSRRPGGSNLKNVGR